MPSLCRLAGKNIKRKIQKSLSNLQNFPSALRGGRQCLGKKSKFDEIAKVDKVHYDQKMKDYGPAKGGKKKKGPNVPKRPLSGCFLFCSEFCPKIKSTNSGIYIGDVAKKLGEMWTNLSDSKKQPYITKAAKLKEKNQKDVADYKSKGKLDGTKDPAKVAQKKVEEEDEEEDEEEEQEEDE
ncbi:High mobility group protein B3 [Sciurus carolinensis]|uniref:High mobility group protein B3 n=1 Tax=Sciurus carolinensis TaxID=30640 RepID=A0AA41NGQ2_SCICA|nr:High mobility group protein B3 [Sciurus carolinensis]